MGDCAGSTTGLARSRKYIGLFYTKQMLIAENAVLLGRQTGVDAGVARPGRGWQCGLHLPHARLLAGYPALDIAEQATGLRVTQPVEDH